MQAEVGTIPVIGQLTSALRAIYVNREDPDSRANTVRAIRQRAAGAAPVGVHS